MFTARVFCGPDGHPDKAEKNAGLEQDDAKRTWKNCALPSKSFFF